jgi:hypothetical protein
VEGPLEDDDADAEADDGLEPRLTELARVDDTEALRADEDPRDEQEGDAGNPQAVRDQLGGDADAGDEHDGADE